MHSMQQQYQTVPSGCSALLAILMRLDRNKQFGFLSDFFKLDFCLM
jgi:hypothetical protein